MSAAISCVEKQPQALCDYDLENMKPGQWIDAHEKYPQFMVSDKNQSLRAFD